MLMNVAARLLILMLVGLAAIVVVVGILLGLFLAADEPAGTQLEPSKPPGPDTAVPPLIPPAERPPDEPVPPPVQDPGVDASPPSPDPFFSPADQLEITYSLDPMPDHLDRTVILLSLQRALDAWTDLNPGLRFTEGGISDVRFKWSLEPGDHWVGLAECTRTPLDTYCVVTAAVGGTSCGGDYVQAESNDLTNTLMHEIGHVLGIGHTPDMSHIMFSRVDPTDPLDEMGYRPPQPLPGAADKADGVSQRIDVLRVKLELEYEALEELREEVVEIRSEYAAYEGRQLPQREYDIAVGIQAELEEARAVYETASEKYNAGVGDLDGLIEDHEGLVERANALTGDPCGHLDG